MVGASVGKIALITEKNLPALQNQNMWRFRPKNDDISRFFIHYFTKKINYEVRNHASGSARDFYRKDIFSRAMCFLPDSNVMKKFDILMLPIFKMISGNLFENMKLSQIRDILLPKLINGEINV